MSPAKKTSVRKRLVKKSVAQKNVVSPAQTTLPSPSLPLYRRLAMGFVVLVAIILLLILFVSTTKVTIQFVPEQTQVQVAFPVSLQANPTSDDQIEGKIAQTEIIQKKTVQAQSEEQKEVIGRASGFVTIFNNRQKAQPLVQTTRLLSSSGVLFRLAEGVTVPPGASVTASVYADEEGSQGDIPADTFTIPGLPTVLQSEVYATSSQSMSGGLQMVSVVTQEEIDEAFKQFEEELLTQTKESLREEKESFEGEWFRSEVKEKTTDTQAGEETDQYELSFTLDVVGVFYDKPAFEVLAQEHLYGQVEKGNQVKNIFWENMTLALTAFDAEVDSAQMTVELPAETIPSLTHPDLDPGIFVGKTKEEIRQYLISHKLAKEVTVTFFPPWIRSAPQLKDHIDIIIE